MLVTGGGGGWARRLTRAIVRSPRPSFRHRGGSESGPPTRILDEDLVARSTRGSRIRSADRRRARAKAALLPWVAVLVSGGALVALALFALSR